MATEPKLEPVQPAKESGQDDYGKLRSLILGDDYESVITERIKSNETDRVAEVLPDAVAKRNAKDDSLSQQFSPLIQSSIDHAVNNNRRQFAQMIYPVIGPAVRKAVASALTEMIAKLNYLLKQSLTLSAVKGRFKAWRLGMSYGEYLILQNLHYQVEQVFLIHQETGLLITSLSSDQVIKKDPDMVSAMLTAISDFISDSFESTSADSKLNAIKFGDFTLLIERGPSAVVAIAVRGVVHQDVENQLQEVSEQVHEKYSDALETFNGEAKGFADVEDILESVLIHEEAINEEDTSVPWFSIIALGLLLVWGVVTGVNNAIMESKVSQVIAAIGETPGYQVLEHQLEDNQLTVAVIHAPGAKSIQQLQQQIDSQGFQLTFKNVLSELSSPTMLASILSQQYSAKFSVETAEAGFVLVARGTLTDAQVESLKSDSLVTSHFQSVRYEPIILSSSIESQYYAQFYSLLKTINNTAIHFDVGSVMVSPEESRALTSTIQNIKALSELAPQLKQKIHQIAIMGYADPLGDTTANLSLSKSRAEHIADMFKANGITESLIITWGMGAKDKSTVPDNLQRRVDIRIITESLE
ncbi:OmpA family protein [Pleionea sediminis]|uniref:OmpA family protein n=1 Tax=Pleionea sediminis TaxID=2569479 RepID=UPI0011867BFA|nr:OmpA family protein [Pleionea sediminis]